MITKKIERQYVERYEYNREFSKKSDPNCGFSFTCDKDGNIFNLDDPYRAENFRKATESGEYVDEGIVKRDISYYIPAMGICECGRKVQLSHSRNTCECGLEYNSFGQDLSPSEEY